MWYIDVFWVGTMVGKAVCVGVGDVLADVVLAFVFFGAKKAQIAVTRRSLDGMNCSF